MTTPLPVAMDAELSAPLAVASPAPEPVVPGPVPPGVRAKAVARRAIVRAARSRPGRKARGTASRVLSALMLEDQRRIMGEVQAVRDDLNRLSAAPDWLADSHRIEINLDLLKAEVRGLDRTLQELGMQLAPATGLDGVGTRIGEMREQLNAVSRRVRQLDKVVQQLEVAPADRAQAAAADQPQAADPDLAGAAAAGALTELFDYVGFEQRFRGTDEAVLAVQQERYADLLAEHAPVLDWGCGRGELLELLAARGVPVVGVDLDAGMVSEARARGLTVHLDDAVGYMSKIEPGSLGAVFSAHVAEHIPFEALLEIVHASLRALRPGGVFIAETPNPASLIVPSNSFILDPTHLRPIHPSLFAFVCESAGFRDVRLHFYSPAEGYHLQRVEDDGSEAARLFNANVGRLNEVLFGPQEYTVIATKAK